MTPQEIADKYLSCAACGDGFIFSAGEQELYRLRGIDAPPRHCPNCARRGVVSDSPRTGTERGPHSDV